MSVPRCPHLTDKFDMHDRDNIEVGLGLQLFKPKKCMKKTWACFFLINNIIYDLALTAFKDLCGVCQDYKK